MFVTRFITRIFLARRISVMRGNSLESITTIQSRIAQLNQTVWYLVPQKCRKTYWYFQNDFSQDLDVHRQWLLLRVRKAKANWLLSTYAQMTCLPQLQLFARCLFACRISFLTRFMFSIAAEKQFWMNKMVSRRGSYCVERAQVRILP